MYQLSIGFKINLITIALTFFLILSSILNYLLIKESQTNYEDKNVLIFNGNKFMIGSAYLTKEARAYVSTGYGVHYDNYWNEVKYMKNREIAIKEIEKIGITHEELAIIEEMLDISNELIMIEAKAMEDIKKEEKTEAKEYLYGIAYIDEVEKIQKLSEEFVEMLDIRTSHELLTIELKCDLLNISICIYTLIILILQVISFLKNKALTLDTDIFSGIYNRNKYIKVLEQIEGHEAGAVGIVHIDMNGLSQINAEYGHEYGDRLLLKLISIMKTCFDDSIFRTGGDEFAALVVNNERLVFDEKLAQLRNILEINTDVEVSLGSVWCTDLKDIENQIAHVNELMQVDKQSYYRNNLSNKNKFRAVTAIEIKNAIDSNDFVVMLQPKTRLLDNEIVGAEALVRKKDGEGGFIAPYKFISIYEADGMISLLDFHVLELVCEILKKWNKEGYKLIPISVNFSRITILEYNVAKKINMICQKYNISPELITIELTEHISNISFESLKEILDSIKALGFKISLDDFGREYANLSIISKIAFDEIKIDKSLIDDLANNAAVKTTIQCVTKMCNAFRPTEMVIEGIETQEQIDELQTLDSKTLVVQGYYFSKPISVKDFCLKHVQKNK